MIRKTDVMLAVALGISLAPASLGAQQVLDSRWRPWLGCWRGGAESESLDIVVCVRPSPDDNGVEIATIENGQVASSRIIVADAGRHPIADEDCSGWQSAAFSADGRRVFLRSELTCADNQRRTGSGIMAIASPEAWLDAQAIGLGSSRVPRVSWYRAAPDADAPAGFEMSAQRNARAAEARVAASGELSLEDVREAAERADAEALVAFLIERGQVFDLEAGDVAALADAGVPDDVIDVLVAVSFPGRFTIDRQAMRASWQPDPPAERRGGRRGYGDPFGWGWWGRGGYFGGCFSGLYWSFYCPGLYSPYYGGAYGWYDPYWYGGGYWRPVIVVRDRTSGSESGRAVGGRGYTRGGQPAGAGRTAKPRSGGAPSSSSRSSASMSGGSSRAGQASPGGYSRGGGGGAGGGGPAKPRGR
jgi:hypothetical protein